MVDIKDFLINDTLVQYNVTNSIISSRVRYRGFLPPTVHLPSVYLQGPASSHHVPQWCTNSQWRAKKNVFIWLSHRRHLHRCVLNAPIRSSVAFLFVSFIFLLLLLFFLGLSVNPNHTSAQRKWQNCMYEVFELCVCEFRCIAPCNHAHESKKLFRASEPIKGLK